MNRAGTICFTTTWAIRPIWAGMKNTPNRLKLFPSKEPHDLATVTARPPALFLAEPKASLCLAPNHTPRRGKKA
jgi:hypothetical protein